ncbi:MAG: glycosyltransferase family 2 protein [Clostridia bacterium]|nr:glycosyltransferase family 2 protein [Clostridia bacterium]
MKLLSIAIPSYNSQDYLHHAVESLLPGGDEVEILIVNDGSKDDTARIADEYERKYPGVVRAVHKENGGHGDAVMTGLQNATGLYFKVVDSDDWVDAEAYPKVLECLRGFAAPEKQIDMLVSNYIYDKAGTLHKHTMSYHHALPQHRVFGWEETRHFRKGQYMLMHSVIYRTQLLRDCGMQLPKHTFYVDELYVYIPLKNVEKMYYLDVDFYHYFIGREDQSVQEQVMIRRIDQALLVNRLLVSEVDPYAIEDKHKRKYMLNYLEIVTAVSSVLLTKSGTEENLRKKEALWQYIKEQNPRVYDTLRRRLMGRLLRLPGKGGRACIIGGYKVAQKIFGFN